MSARQFELWLDESGDFLYDDLDLNKKPSLVGGVLVKKGNLSEQFLRELFTNKAGTTFIHSTELKNNFGNIACNILTEIQDKIYKFICFKNTERVLNVTRDETYLNILSEGINKLMQILLAEYGEVELDVLIAVRVKEGSTDGQIIDNKDYVERLRKKVSMSDLERYITPKNLKLSFASARYDQRLMLADVVCNTYLTIEARKFDAVRNIIKKLLNSNSYEFSLAERINMSLFRKYLIEGNYGECILICTTPRAISNMEDNIESAIDKLLMHSSFEQKLAFENITNIINSMILSGQGYYAEGILKNIIKNVISKLSEITSTYTDKKIYDKFYFDVHMLLFTFYTHEGNIKLADEEMKMSLNYLNRITHNFENLESYFIFQNRRAIHLSNTFDYYSCIQCMKQVKETIEQITGVLPLADGLGDICSNLNSEQLNKAVGTSLQARTHLIRKQMLLKGEKTELDQARYESDFVINAFESFDDKSRQYQYRCEIECEAGEYSTALHMLSLAAGLEKVGLKELVSVIKDNSPYLLMHYVRIMAESALDSHSEMAKEMYNQFILEKCNESKSLTEDINKCGYVNIITLWKYGSYLGTLRSVKASVEYFDKAIAVSDKNLLDLTLRAIGLGIKAEKAAVLKEAGNKYSKDYEKSKLMLINDYNDFMKEALPDSMRSFFQEWNRYIERIDDIKSLWRLARDIRY